MKSEIKYFLVFLCFWTSAFSDSDSLFITTHVNKGDWQIVFPVEGSSRETFVDYHLALDLVRVECDGLEVTPEVIEGAFHFNYASRPAGVVTIYSCVHRLLDVAIFEGGDFSEGKIRRYEIPAGTKRLSASYRVRYPDGSVSKVLNMQSEDILVVPVRR